MTIFRRPSPVARPMSTLKKPTPTQRIIRASEIGQYKYCAHAWWLSSVLGVPSNNTRELAHGEAHHQTHGRQVQTASVLRWVALVVLLLAIAITLLSIRH